MTKILTTISALIFLATPAMAVTDHEADQAIIGEAGGQSSQTMLAVAGALRNRIKAGLGLRGVFGLRNPSIRHASAKLWRQARVAWVHSATNDITGGLMYFGGPGDADYFLNQLHFRKVRQFGEITFYRP